MNTRTMQGGFEGSALHLCIYHTENFQQADIVL